MPADELLALAATGFVPLLSGATAWFVLRRFRRGALPAAACVALFLASVAAGMFASFGLLRAFAGLFHGDGALILFAAPVTGALLSAPALVLLVVALAMVSSRRLAVSPDLAVQTLRLGSGYGGWDILPDELPPGAVVYAFGVGEDASFDVALIERFEVTVHAFDPTPRSIEWVARQGFPERFVMHPYGVAAFDGDVAFHPPENPAHVSHTLLERPATQAQAITVPVKRLGSILRELGHARVDLLKLDIEGAEYEVLEDMARDGIRPRLLLVEFHHRFPGVGVRRTKAAIAALRAQGYRLFSVSGTQEEFGFVYRGA